MPFEPLEVFQCEAFAQEAALTVAKHSLIKNSKVEVSGNI